MSIIVKHLTKMYGQQSAVKNISFKVDTGEIVGFLGPNGAGKSTTLKIITGYLSATKGQVFIDDQEHDIGNKEIKKHIGYLPEHNPLYLDLYIQEYLSMVMGIHQIPKKDRKNRLKDIMDLCGLEKEFHKKIAMLSKGYRQRVGLASVLIHDPHVLILDEPTTGLDPNQIIEIRHLIKEVSKNKTVLFSSHIMQEVEALCDRVIILNEGEIIANNTIGELSDLKDGIAYKVTFSSALDHSTLDKIPSIKSYTMDSTTDNTYIIRTNNEENNNGLFFNIAVENNLKLLHLSQEQKSLEALFRELTTQS